MLALLYRDLKKMARGSKDYEHEVRLRVRYHETDRMGVVYHSNHLVYFEVGRTELMRARKIRYADLEREGLILAVTQAHADFLAPVTYDDEIAIRTSISIERKIRIRFDYGIFLVETGREVCRGYTLHAFLGREGRPIRIPERVMEAIENRERVLP